MYKLCNVYLPPLVFPRIQNNADTFLGYFLTPIFKEKLDHDNKKHMSVFQKIKKYMNTEKIFMT